MRLSGSILATVLLVLAGAGVAGAPAGEEVPVREAVSRQPEFAALQQRVFDYAAEVLDQPVLERVKLGKRLLAVSREAVKRIFYLSYTYRITGDTRMADRAIREMEAVCGFVDWNPLHFLDVGEMCLAVSIGYDWLYDRIPEGTREQIRKALVNKGFEATRSPVTTGIRSATADWYSRRWPSGTRFPTGRNASWTRPGRAAPSP